MLHPPLPSWCTLASFSRSLSNSSLSLSVSGAFLCIDLDFWFHLCVSSPLLLSACVSVLVRDTMQELERSREIKYRAVTEAVRFVLSPGMSLRLGELGTFQWSPQCDGEEQRVEHEQEESVEVKLVEEQKGAAAPAAGAAAGAGGGGVRRFVMVGGPAAPLPSLPSVAMDSTTIKRQGGGVIDMKVDNSDPSKSVVRIPPGSGGWYRTIFGSAPPPLEAVACWSIRSCSRDRASYIQVGGHRDPLASSGNPAWDPAAVVWWGGGGWTCAEKYKHTHVTDEPGLGVFRGGDVFHLKYDPQSLQLHLRVDRTPNRTFTATLRPAPHYYACLGMYAPGVCEVQAEAATC